jgi:hypothetical protein
MLKRKKIDDIICDSVEDGDIYAIKKFSRYHSLRDIKTPFNGLNLLCVAPHREVAKLLIDVGVEQEDESGQLLSVCYDDVAECLTKRNLNIQPALQYLQSPRSLSLSPTTARQCKERIVNLKRWKEEANRVVCDVLVCHDIVIKDLAKLVVTWL